MSTTTELAFSDVFAAGAIGLGVVALIIGIVLIVLLIRAAMRGEIQTAILIGMILITLVSPTAGLIIAIIALIVLALMGNVYLGAYAFGGWLVGILILFIAGVALAAMGLATGTVTA